MMKTINQSNQHSTRNIKGRNWGINRRMEEIQNVGLVFTPTVNGKNGCYPLSLKLREHFETNIKYYSGSVPKVESKTYNGRKRI